MIPEYTFEQDKLDRKSVSDSIEKHLEHIQQKNPGQAVSFAINAKWGEGKTYFISMWKNLIEQRNQDAAVYYNAWENDDCDSAILPLLYNIISIEENEESGCFVEHAQFFLKTLGMNTLKFGVKRFLGDNGDFAGIFQESLDASMDTNIRTVFSEYDEYYGKRKQLQENLKKLIPVNGNLWIFIDDLDRCNPRFAINTLECIKHFFDISNIIFIFAIDYNHLVIAAEQVYGSEIDSTSYLKKFFDVIYQLPSPNKSHYIDYKIRNIKDINMRMCIQGKLLDFYFKKFDFSLRDIDLTMTHVELFLLEYYDKLKLCKDINSALNVYFYFMAVKDKYNKEYTDMIHGHFSVDKAGSGIWPPLNPKFYVNDEITELLETISNGQAERHTVDIIEKYSLINIPSVNTFCSHIEYALR